MNDTVTKWCFICVLLSSCLLSACSTQPQRPSVESRNSKPIPLRTDRNHIRQLAKSDIDRLADIEIEENKQSLKVLMLKLYKRNPREARKLAANHIDVRSPENIIESLFDINTKHQWQFSQLNHLQSIDAINLAFRPEFKGDRVFALIVGMYTMLLKAHNKKDDFYFTDKLEPQSLYNMARNIEIVAWKIANAQYDDGTLMLLTNEQNAQVRNLSFEREFSKMIARTDLLALLLAEKSQRLITRITQSIATSALLPF